MNALKQAAKGSFRAVVWAVCYSQHARRQAGTTSKLPSAELRKFRRQRLQPREAERLSSRPINP